MTVVRRLRHQLLRPDTIKRLKRLPPTSRERVLRVASTLLNRHPQKRCRKWAGPKVPTLTRRESVELTNLLRPEVLRRLENPSYQERRESAEAAEELLRLTDQALAGRDRRRLIYFD